MEGRGAKVDWVPTEYREKEYEKQQNRLQPEIRLKKEIKKEKRFKIEDLK